MEVIENSPSLLRVPSVCRSKLRDDTGRYALLSAGFSISDLAERLIKAWSLNQRIAVTGLEHLGFESQKVALQLAEMIGAWVLGTAHGTKADPWASCFSQLGSWLASWSEMRQRSDGLLLWYAPLWESHPRWLERFGPVDHHAHRLAVVEPACQSLPEGWIEDQIIRLDPSQALNFLVDLRIVLNNPTSEPSNSELRRVVHHFRNSKWLTLVRSEDPPGFVDPFGIAEQMTSLVKQCNEGSHRVVFGEVPGSLNQAGLKSILSWRTGLNLPVHFSAEGPVYRPDELKTSEIELLLIFGDDIPNWVDHPVQADCIRFHSPLAQPLPAFMDKTVSVCVRPHSFSLTQTWIRDDGVAIQTPDTHTGGLAGVQSLISDILAIFDTRSMTQGTKS